MKGRKPKPIARQIAEGDPRKKGRRKLQERLAAEPEPSRGLPPCPSHLRGRARSAWNFLRQELKDVKLDFRADAFLLEGLCANYARAVEAGLILAREGLTIEQPIVSSKGEPIGVRIKNHPAVAISNAAWKLTSAFCSDFGLSPVARMRLAIEIDDGEADLMSILSKPRQAKVPIQ